MRRDTWEVVPSISVSDNNLIPGAWSFECKRKHYWTIKKFKSRYFVSWDVHDRLTPGPFSMYSPVIQCVTVRLMLIFLCILVFQSQSIDFKNDFSQSDITSGESVLIELPRDFNSDGGQCDVVLRLKKNLYDKADASCLWYENLLYSL